MKRANIKRIILAMIGGGVLPITTASCDPIRGFSFFRDDDHNGFFDIWVDDSFHHDDCFFDDCFFGDLWFF